VNTETKRVARLRRRAYREGQRALLYSRNPYWPGSLHDAWNEGHKDVHFYGINQFHPTTLEMIALFVGFVAVIIIITSIVSYLVRN